LTNICLSLINNYLVIKATCIIECGKAALDNLEHELAQKKFKEAIELLAVSDFAKSSEICFAYAFSGYISSLTIFTNFLLIK
jgi:hypothetical protein